MDDSVVSMPLTDVERRTLAMLGSLRPDDDDGASLALLAGRVQRLRDAGGLGIGVGHDVLRGLAIAEEVLCLLLASRPAEQPQSVVDRSRLFARHRGRQASRVGLFLSSALESDRRRLGMGSRELGL